MIKLKSLITEGKITSDVDRAAKKIGIKFKKKVKTKFTNDFTGVNEPGENVKYDSWMDMNPPDNYEDMARDLISALDGKYVRMKPLKYTSGGGMVFRKKRKDPKTEFTIIFFSQGNKFAYLLSRRRYRLLYQKVDTCLS